MGIRVDPDTLDRQLTIAGADARRSLPFHRDLLAGKLPQTAGGGIGQSRICMFFLDKAHVGEVQCSVWPDEIYAGCESVGVTLL
jgi:aspartate--ammonia ligase